MSDLLNEAAISFSKSLEFDYLFKLGNKKRQILLSVISNNKSEFTHIFGLDHLDDIPIIKGHNSGQKEAIFEKILDGKIGFDDIKNSQNLNEQIKGSYNFYTQKPYTISERLSGLKEFETILDNSYNGSIRRWNSTKCKVILPNGQSRKVKIPADFLLTVPSAGKEKERFYLFLYQTNKKAPRTEPIKLSIFSAFPDCVDLTKGQESPFTILELEKLNIKTNEKTSIFIRPSYKLELEKNAVINESTLKRLESEKSASAQKIKEKFAQQQPVPKKSHGIK